MRGKKGRGKQTAEEAAAELRDKAETMFDRVDEDHSGYLDISVRARASQPRWPRSAAETPTAHDRKWKSWPRCWVSGLVVWSWQMQWMSWMRTTQGRSILRNSSTGGRNGTNAATWRFTTRQLACSIGSMRMGMGSWYHPRHACCATFAAANTLRACPS